MKIEFSWIGGATFILRIGDLKIAVDPALSLKGSIHDFFWFKSKRTEDPIYSDLTFELVDLWLISHTHSDHLDEVGKLKIVPGSTVICNRTAYKKLKNFKKKDLTPLKWNQSKSLSIKGYEINIESIPAIHGVNPMSAFFAGNVNGYLLKIKKKNDSVCIYITGDTVHKKRIRKALLGKKIDLMIPNMGAAKSDTWIMTLTLNSNMLQKLISELNPKYVIPVHYGTFEHYYEKVDSILEIPDERIKIVPVGSQIILDY